MNVRMLIDTLKHYDGDAETNISDVSLMPSVRRKSFLGYEATGSDDPARKWKNVVTGEEVSEESAGQEVFAPATVQLK